MKTAHNFLFILIATLFLQSCIGNKASNSRKSLSSSSTATPTTTPTTPTFSSDESFYWFTTVKVTGTITINKNSENVVYLRGLNIHNFLTSVDSNSVANYQKQFCVVATYAGTYKQLRLRAVPIFVSNYTTKSIERLLRVDVPSKNESAQVCNNSISDLVLPAEGIAYSLADICPASGCLGVTQVTSSALAIYQSGSPTKVPAAQLLISGAGIKIDLQSNSTSPESTCSNTSCEAKGFDCCLEGQCVKDATEKSSAANESNYSQAISAYKINPMSFLNYPNVYNVCLNFAHNPPAVVPTDIPTAISAAEKRVKDYLADYNCIMGFDSSANYNSCVPAAVATYDAAKLKLATACGCPTSYTPAERALKCPDWGLRPLYKSSIISDANIVDFYCYTPAPANPIGPITNLNVSVSGRTAPHRFYEKNTGTTYPEIGKLSASILQEGDAFFYADIVGKTSPVNSSYNVNSILGSMNVDLSQTQPAKMVDVELGQTYILSATSGYFTPCSQCAKDSWFQTFSAHPVTTNGIGLRATGYSTSRDSYAANTTNGNYEDTHFGRACYLPVTMIPLSHKKETNVIDQRINRLKTQTAYYVNGYQKDWFGFNKGALIGSFDGVSWFAIGSGRRITTTSTKLYLAINGSFLDLADRTDTIVNIIPDRSGNSAADFDYDPALSLLDSRQNSAGTCQKYHQCSTDTDCVAQLGWEYACADVSQMRTRWPLYNTEAQELSGDKVGSIFELLQTTTAGDSVKRCVYRGAGAPCLRDFTTLNGKANQKNLTCAPNFYCAALTAGVFNNEVARSPNEFDNIYFGMDTNVLGRPLKYVTANKTLNTEIVANIKSNGATDALGLTTAEVDNMGICRPGKSQSPTESFAHANPDGSKRTDYISQVGSCSSAAVGSLRTVACPAFGDDLNYLPYDSTSPLPVDAKRMQNSCGGEAKHTTTFLSAFNLIEGVSLQSLSSITQPILAADACLRRAGSVCHTDLDCGPNKLHAEMAGSMALAYFGGTEAEQSYWKESLICGQGTPTPSAGTANYYNYNLNENRCCREIGSDFTMYTSGSSSIIPENMGTNVTLNTRRIASNDPKAANRYSRYAVSKTAQEDGYTIPTVEATKAPAKNQWKVINETGSLTCCGGGWIRKFADGTHDWNVKNRLNLDTSNFSCLNYRSPLAAYDYSTFAADNIVQSTYQREYEYFCKSPGQNGCMQILYRDISGYSILPPLRYEPSDPTNLEPDYDFAASAYTADPAYTASPVAGLTRLDTAPVGDVETEAYTFKMNRDVPYQPFPYYFTQTPPYDLYEFSDGSKKPLRFFTSKTLDYGVSLYLPAYIPFVPAANAITTGLTPTISAVYIKYQYADGKKEVVNITSLRETDLVKCNAITTYSSGTGQPVDAIRKSTNPADPEYHRESWCVQANDKTSFRPVIHVRAYTGAGRAWQFASVVIDFMPLERYKLLNVATPGNAYYYLTKLGRLELLGIPQITYEPIYCNNDQNKLVPGIFTTNMSYSASNPTWTQRQVFSSNAISYAANPTTEVSYGAYPHASFDPIQSYDEEGTSENEVTANYGNVNKLFTYQNNIAHGAVFSSKEFACCTPLGKETTTAAKCCSGAATTADGKTTCKLPAGTDLNVYFNKFVSSEGVGDTQPGGGLLITGTEDEVDFNEYTGEPKMRASTFQKLEELGKSYCQNGIVANGGSFGAFPPEPYSGYTTVSGSTISFPMSIVDSILDSDADDANVGKFPFDNGYRWDHHYYCK